MSIIHGTKASATRASANTAGPIAGLPAAKNSRRLLLMATVGVLALFVTNVANAVEMSVKKPTHSVAPAATGPLGLWHLDFNALDGSGHGHNGVINGATPIPDGVAGGAYRFNGSSGIDVGDFPFPDSAYSVNIWLRTTQPAVTEDWRVPINKADSPPGGNQTFELFLGDGRPGSGGNAPAYAVWHDGSTVSLELLPSNTNISGRDGKWHMATATYQTGKQDLYVDGCLAATGSYAGQLPLTSNSVVIGGRDNFGPFHHSWIGDLDEVSIYGRSLASAEVVALYRLYRPNAGCGQVSGFNLTQAICYDLTTMKQLTARIAGAYWNCAGLVTAPHDQVRTNVIGTAR